ncbi:MAG: DUF6525 family protein [Pseudomonadota bacterium]
MAGHNRGKTSLRRRRHTADPMRDYDRLPTELRRWLATAALPWSAVSARKAWDRAMERTLDPDAALSELDRLQDRLIAKDAPTVWGGAHPVAVGD